MRRLLVAGLLGVLAACASAGTNYDPAKADQLVPGESTRAEAVKLLGKPNSETFRADSSVILLWMHSRGTAWGTGKSRSLAILFDKDGRMLRLLQRTETKVH